MNEKPASTGSEHSEPQRFDDPREAWQAKLDELTDTLRTGLSPGPEGVLQRAQTLANMGTLCNMMGRPQEMVRYLTEARELAPTEPTLRPLLKILDTYTRVERETPWDVDGAVTGYDDVHELLANRGLPFEAFFEATRRGAIRKTICRMIRTLHKPGQRILEVGCAAGGYYASLLPFVDTSGYVAVDWTPAMVRRAKRVFPHLPVMRMDVRDLSFVDNAFPLVFSTDVLMHVEAWRTGLEELYRVAEGALVLRIRVHRDDVRPTLVTHIGDGPFRVPYVINNQSEFVELIRSFSPAPADILVPSAMDEQMYDDLWQVARNHPELLEDWNGETPPSIDRILDLVVLKKPA